MVAVFTGTGLGLFNSSATQVGASSSGVGHRGERPYVNLASGNLVLQDIDESVLTRGLSIAFLRTYNSRGLATEAGRQTQIGADGWINVFERKVSNLTGTVNTVGSTVTRTLGDGSEVVYAWDASRAAYVSTVGEGAHDTITWTATGSLWTWTEGSTLNREVYDASGTNGGRLLRIIDARSAAQYNLTYTAAGPTGLVSTIYSSLTNGDGLSFTYTSGRLTKVSTREGGVTIGQVDYGYDAQGRLITVTTDLTPGTTSDNTWSATASANDGKLYRTTYSYVGTSLQIASVLNSDGTQLSFVYDGSGRVTHVTLGDDDTNDADGLGQTTVYSYGATDAGTNLTSVTVTDASGRAWTYKFHATTNQLHEVHAPAVDGVIDVTSYAYDTAGNITQVETRRGATVLARTNYEYDLTSATSNGGNVLKQWDLQGNRIDRAYDANNQLLTETRYTAVDTNGPVAGGDPAASTGLTTRYVYNTTTGRLRYVINAAQEVTQYVYGTTAGANGQVTTMRRFVGATYTSTTALSETNLNSWAAATAQLQKSERTDYVYDAMGRLSEQRTFAQVAQTAGTGVVVGDGVLDASTEIVKYSYDAQGLLRQRIVDRGAVRTLGAAAAAGDEVTDYLYDGMGRLLSVLTRDFGTAAMPDRRTNLAGYTTWLAANDATTVLTQYIYTDSGNTIAVTTDTGATRTEVRDAHGRLISVTEQLAAGNTSGQRVTNRKYDRAGRLIAEESLIEATPTPINARSYFLYDAKGMLTAQIDATGAVVEYVRDGMDRVVETRRYANRVTPQESWWTGTPPSSVWRSDTMGTAPATAVVVTVDATRDRVVQATYDTAGRLATEVVVGVDNSQTQRTTYTYDAAHRLLQVSVTDGANTAATARTTRYLYDNADRQIATIDALNYVTETVYDLAGRVVKTIRYANASASPAATTLASLRPALNATHDQTTRVFYDGRGNRVGVLETLSNTEGYLTEYVYDEGANQRAVRAYSRKLTGLTGSETFAALKTTANTATVPPTELVRETRRTFNSLGQLIAEVNHEGTSTSYLYDEAGRLVRTQSATNVSGEIRENNARYDALGNLIGEMSGEQVAQAMANLLGGKALNDPTLTPAQLDAAYSQYGVRHSVDALGRRTESIDAQGNKTWYYYDGEGRQTFVVKGVHDGGNVQNAQGEVTETRYDAFGQVIDSLAYSGRIAIAVPGTRSSVDQVVAQLTAIAATQSRVQLAYDRRGLLIERTDAEGYRTSFDYNAFGETATSRTWVGAALYKKTAYAYDKRGALLNAVESNAESGASLSRETSTTYDAFGRATTRTDARGIVTTASYDRLGRQIGESVDLGGGRIEAVAMSYDAYSRVVTRTDALGNVTTYAYSDADRTMTVTTPENVAIVTTHNRFGQTVTVSQVQPGGATATTTTNYDRNGQVVSVVDPLNQTASNSYDVRGLLTSTVDASGRRVDYSYDAVGRLLTRVEDPGSGKLNLTTTYAYDGQGRQITVTDASGRVTTMAYDRKGNLTETVRDPNGLALRTTYGWDRDGRQLTVTEGAGSAVATTTAYGYDAFGRRTSEVVDPGAGKLNLTTSYAYDGNDNVVSRTDASGRVTRYVYDGANRMRYSIDGAGGVVEMAYDKAGRTTMTRAYAKVADATSLGMTPTEAQVSALIQSQSLSNDALDEATYRLYDRDGRVRLRIDGAGGVVETVYDVAGRVARETRYAQAVSMTPTLRTALRDATATVASVGATPGAADESVRHVYDAAGQRRYSVDATGGYRAVWYDPAGRVAVTRSFTQRLNMANISDGMTVAQINAMNLWGATDDLEMFVYDAAGRQRYVLQTVGDPTVYPFTAAVTERTYDGADRVLSTRAYIPLMTLDTTLIGKLGAGTAVEADFAAFVATNAGNAQSNRSVYDAAGRLQYDIDGVGGYTRYRYDASSRLVAVRKAVTTLNLSTITDATTALQLESVVVAADADELSTYTYDAAGRLRYTMKAVGSALVRPFPSQLTETRYDGAGRVLATHAYTAYFTVDEATIQKMAVGTATDADFSAFTAANVGTAQTARSVYDAAGRAVYSIDATGAYARTWYDAIGRATTVRRFATAFNPAALNDGTTVAQLTGISVQNDSADLVEYRVYDAAGRATIVVDALGFTTKTDFDGAGRATITHAYASAVVLTTTLKNNMLAGAATVADFATFTNANEATARAQYQVYDAAGRTRYVVTRSGSGTGDISGREYDGIGQVVKDHRYDVPVPFSPTQSVADVDTALQAAFSTDPTVRATQTRTTQYVYDAAGLQRFAMDATGALSEQRYDGAGQVVETRSYGNLPTGVAVTMAALSTWGQGQASADVRKVTNSYDAAGRLTARTDALDHSESFTYDGAGRMLTRTDRMNAVWTYQYDAAGRRTAEISPVSYVFGITALGVLSASNRTIATRYVYDALGQLTRKTEDADNATVADRRITDYVYDSRGNLIRTILPHPGEIDWITGNHVFNGPAPTIETTYDALGQVVVQKDERGHYRYRAYDTLGRMVAEIDQEKNVTSFVYNAYGEQTQMLRYATALNTGVPAFAGWQAANAMSLTMIQAGTTANPADRTIATAYDRLGRKTQVTLPSVTYFRQDGTQTTGTPTTQFVYNAYGETVKESVLLEGTAGQGDAVWANTWRYYDAAGRNTLTVDAEGYVTAMTYNVTGDAVKTVEYARAIATAGLSTQTPPALPGAGDANTGYDREMRWTYDVLGRKVSEIVVRRHHLTNGSPTQRDVVTTYAYDNEDRVVGKTDDTGTTVTTYNALGQVIALREPVRSVLVADAETQLLTATNTLQTTALYQQRSPYTTMAYDGLGRLIAARRHANGHDGVNTPMVDDTRDQVMLTYYDQLDRAVMSQGALDWNIANPGAHRTYSAYDTAGNLTHRWQYLTAGAVQAHQWFSYDKVGRQTETRATRVTISDGATVGTDQLENVQYNAFGEIVGKTFGSAATNTQLAGTLSYTYDNAGRLTANNESGAPRNFGYNLAGHQLREWHSLKPSATAPVITVVTVNKTDALGRTIRMTLPSHTTDENATTVMRQTVDRWGNVVQIVDARGYQTDYQYNDLNQVVRETRPLVWVVGENGAGASQRPVNQWYYDALGRLIGTRDANGNLRTTSYDAVGRQMATTDGLGAVTRYAYDIFNNQRLVQDALGYITFKSYDRGDRVTAIGDFLSDNIARTRNTLQAYGLNVAGDRISVMDALNNTAYSTYDSQHRLLGTLSAAGVAMNYGYDVRGNKILETNGLTNINVTVADRDGGTAVVHAQTWKYDAYGRVTDHNNLSGRDFNYLYDATSGVLLEESQSGGGGGMGVYPDGIKSIEYYPNGRVKKIVETGGNIYRYEYDAAGNRTYEWTTASDPQGYTVNLLTRSVYDSNNRLQRATQDEVDSAGTPVKRVFELTYDYDANGNRRRVLTQSGYGVNVTGITATNTAPTVAMPVADRGVRKGQISEFRLLFTDVFRDAQNDALTLTIAQSSGAALPSWLTATRDTQTGEIVFVANVPAGAIDDDVVVRLTAFETATPANTVNTTFTVKVRNNNAPTVVAAPTTLPAKLNQPFGRDLLASEHFADIDVGDTLSLSVLGTLPAWLTVDTSVPGRVRLNGTPTVQADHTFTLRATDSTGAWVEKTITISAAPNHAPTVVAVPGPQDATPNRSFIWVRDLAQVFADADNEALQVIVTGLPSWLSYQLVREPGAAPQLRISGVVPPTATLGDIYNVQLTATDGSGATATTGFAITVSTNVAPYAPTVDNKIAKQNLLYGVTLPEFYDDNGDTLTYSATGLPPGLTFNPANRQITGTPTTPGSWVVSYSAYDGRVTTTTTFTIVVEANNPPQAPSVGNQTGIRTSPVYLVLPAFTDPNGDTLAHSVSNLPPGLSFNAATREITGTPTTAGSWTVTYSANDGRLGTASTTFVFTIDNPASNLPPALSIPLADQLLTGGAPFSFSFPANSFIDPEGLGLTYTHQVIAGPTAANWLSFNPGTRTFSNTPGQLPPTLILGPWTVRVTATDNIGQWFSDEFTITIDDPGGSGESFPGGGEAGILSFDMGMSAMSGPTPPQTQERWFSYDAENRIRINGGTLNGAAGGANTTIVLTPLTSEGGGHENAYDAVGRVVAVYTLRTLNGNTVTSVERTAYDQRGNRQYEYHTEILGFASGGFQGIRTQYVYDAANRMTESRTYYQLNETRYTDYAPEGQPELREIGGWLHSAAQVRYDADGRVRWQKGYDRPDDLATVAWYMSPTQLARQFNDLTVLSLANRTDYTWADATPNNDDDNLSSYDLAGRVQRYRYSARDPGNSWYTHTFDSTYVGWDSYQELTVAGTSSNTNYKPTTNTLGYDGYGRLIQQSEDTEYDTYIPNRIRAYTYNAEGQVLTRRHGTWENNAFKLGDADPNTGALPIYNFVYAAGQQLAQLSDGGNTRLGSILSIGAVAGTGAYSAGGGMVTVQPGETLRTLAKRVYGNEQLWYVIADANGLNDSNADLIDGQQLKAPSAQVNRNDADTFRPYDPSEAIGPTSPSLPYIAPPPTGNCGMVVRILAVVVAAVVAYVTWDPVTTFNTYAAIVAAGGEAVAQTIEISEGTRQGYNWGSVAVAGVSSGWGGSGWVDTGKIAFDIAANAAITASINYVGSYSVNKLTGVEDHFSWRSLLATATTAAITASIFKGKGDPKGQGSTAENAAFSWKEVAAAAVKEVGRSVVRQGIGYAVNKAFDVETSWNWRQVAYSAATDAAVAGVVAGVKEGLAVIDAAKAQAAEPAAPSSDDVSTTGGGSIVMGGPFGVIGINPMVFSLGAHPMTMMAASGSSAAGGATEDDSEADRLIRREEDLIGDIRAFIEKDIAADRAQKQISDEVFDQENVLMQATIVAGGIADSTISGIKSLFNLIGDVAVGYAESRYAKYANLVPIPGSHSVGFGVYAATGIYEKAEKLKPYVELVGQALEHEELGPMLIDYAIEKWRALPKADKSIAIGGFVVDVALTLFTGYGAAKLADRLGSAAVNTERVVDALDSPVDASALSALGKKAMEIVQSDRRLREMTRVVTPSLGALREQLQNISYKSTGKKDLLAFIEKNPEQATALSRALSGMRADEARGTVYAFERMTERGYTMLDADVKYGSNNGIDLVFKKGDKFAILEAKHGKDLSSLATDTNGLRQGSWDWIDDRLKNALRAKGTDRALIRQIQAARESGKVESFAALYRGDRLAQLNFTSKLNEGKNTVVTIARPKK